MSVKNPTAANTSRMNIKKLATLAMLAAIAFVVTYISNIIFRPFALLGFLQFDLKDVIIAIAGFIYGPLAVVGVSLVVSIVEMFTVSPTGYIGLIMNVLSTCAFVCPAAFIYRSKKSVSRAVIGLIAGGILVTAVMLLWNYLITPLYLDVTREQVVGLLVPIFLPFNLVKAAMNLALTLLLYKPLVTALRKANLLANSGSISSDGAKRNIKWGVTLCSLVLLATCILLVLVLSGKI